MKGKGILFIIGIMLIVSNYTKFIVVNVWWIVLCFFVWFVMLYISIRQKNRDRDTPRPVYLAE